MGTVHVSGEILARFPDSSGTSYLEPCEPTQTKLQSEDKWVVYRSSFMAQNSIYNNKDRNTVFDFSGGLPPFHTAVLDT